MATHTAPILDRIVESRRAWVEELKAKRPQDRTFADSPAVRDFRQALLGERVALIAECKERSPSGGLLQPGYNPVALARRYMANGASALSVLTEPHFFGGSLEHLRAVRSAVDIPILCKDFVIDPVQLTEARVAGADAVLLIVAILGDGELRSLYRQAIGLGMSAVVEVHDGAELDRALAIEPAIIGINNRDLTKMQTNKSTTARLRARIPPTCVVISESGIDSRKDIDELARLGVDAALVGESLLRAPDLDAKARELSGR
ncbi:MAG TPA: indole-3-glycerol phosphate synthase TrpC [Candidatus Dormibacteraeota bacterium]|nr:indole-3-glycerol phosphate synthase TrpC [Candidatus Dormibacteraeota bacterium]